MSERDPFDLVGTDTSVQDVVRQSRKRINALARKNVRANQLEHIAQNAGDIGDYTGNSVIPAEGVTINDPTDVAFSGKFRSQLGIDFGGELYSEGVVLNGTLVFGITLDGSKVVCGSSTIIDEDGITVGVDATIGDVNSYKIADASGNIIGAFTGRKSTDPDAINHVEVSAKALSGRNPLLNLISTAVSGKNATAYLGANIESGNAVSVQFDASANEIWLAAQNLKTSFGYITPVTSFTPTATNVLNMGSTSSIVGYYMRVHDFVFAWGSIGIDPTAAGTLTEVRLTLPIASAMTTGSNLIGGISRTGTATSIGIVTADSTNDQALLRFTPDIATNATYGFWFAYQIK